MPLTWQDKARALMDVKQIPQQRIADSLSVSKGTVSHWLHGRHRPSLKQLREIARVLEVSLPELIEGDEAFVRDEVEQAVLQELRSIDRDRHQQALELVKAVLSTPKQDS